MKKIILFAVVTMMTVSSFAQSEKYIAAMKKNIMMIDSAFVNPDAFLALANTFERIGTSEKNQWLPYYYAAYCRINYGFMQKDPSDNDPIALKAAELIAKADSLEPNNSEVSVLKSMNATLRMIVNPMQRYMEFGTLISKENDNAMAQDPANPRPYMVKGQNLKNTPEQFGGGCMKAKPILQTAAEKFATFKPASDIHPNWGGTYNQKQLDDCGK